MGAPRAASRVTLAATLAWLDSRGWRPMAPAWTSGMRSGDTSLAERSAQDRRLPSVLVTTPESLSLMLSRSDALDRLQHVRLVVVDEWHALLGNKRGVQVQLALARLRRVHPQLMTWGLSATLGNPSDALQALVGVCAAPDLPPLLVRGETAKQLIIDTLLPERAERFAWAGHMGLRMLPQVVRTCTWARPQAFAHKACRFQKGRHKTIWTALQRWWSGMAHNGLFFLAIFCMPRTHSRRG